jgi:hypothetical protein
MQIMDLGEWTSHAESHILLALQFKNIGVCHKFTDGTGKSIIDESVLYGGFN